MYLQTFPCCLDKTHKMYFFLHGLSFLFNIEQLKYSENLVHKQKIVRPLDVITPIYINLPVLRLFNTTAFEEA